MNNIEEGCLAVVVGATIAENNGKVVRVGKYIGDKGGLWQDRDYWETDKPLRTGRFYSDGTWELSTDEYSASERVLMRIDGFEDNESERQKDKELCE